MYIYTQWCASLVFGETREKRGILWYSVTGTDESSRRLVKIMKKEKEKKEGMYTYIYTFLCYARLARLMFGLRACSLNSIYHF